MRSDTSKWRKKQLGEIVEPIKGTVPIACPLHNDFSSIEFPPWIESMEVLGANQTHFTGFQFACMQNVDLHSTRIFFGKSDSSNLREPTVCISQIPSPDQSGRDNPTCARRAA